MTPRVALFALPLLAASLAGQSHALCPDWCHLTEFAIPGTLAGGSSNWWTTTATGRHIQVLYESSHFTGKAAAGVMTIHTLSFRGEDFEPNLGGQTFTGITVDVYTTTLDTTTMSTTGMLANTSNPASTLLSSTTIPSLTVLPSLGTVPNNYHIVLPVNPAVYDPNTGDSLLVDINWTGYTGAPDGTAMILTQDCTTSVNTVRGRGIYSPTSGAASGGSSTNPPIMNVEFSGTGGSTNPVTARTEYIGASCGGAASSFYEFWPGGTRFDLAGTTMLLVPDVYPNPSYYTVVPGGPAFDPTKVDVAPDSTSDNGLVAHSLTPDWQSPFSFPGGSTTTISPSTNGYVWLDPAMTASDSTATVAKFLSATGTWYSARFALCWTDLHAGRNTTTHPNSGMHALNDTSGGPGNTDTYVTWLEIGRFNSATTGGQSVNSFQLVLHEATGVVEMRFGTMGEQWGGCLTGFTQGRIGGSGGTGSVDPQSMDLSAELSAGPFPPPFRTWPEGATGNVALTAVSGPLAAGNYGARWFGGQTVTFDIAGIPAGTTIAWTLLDLAPSVPGIQVPGITAPGCRISTSLTPVFTPWEQFVLPGTSVVGAQQLVVPHGWEGMDFTAQAIGIDVFGGPYLIPWASNAIRFTAGLQ